MSTISIRRASKNPRVWCLSFTSFLQADNRLSSEQLSWRGAHYLPGQPRQRASLLGVLFFHHPNRLLHTLPDAAKSLQPVADLLQCPSSLSPQAPAVSPSPSRSWPYNPWLQVPWCHGCSLTHPSGCADPLWAQSQVPSPPGQTVTPACSRDHTSLKMWKCSRGQKCKHPFSSPTTSKPLRFQRQPGVFSENNFFTCTVSC